MMTKRPTKPPKSDRPKLILAAILALILLVVLVQQFGGQSPESLTLDAATDSLPPRVPTPFVVPNQSASNQVRSNQTSSGTTLPPRPLNPTPSTTNRSSQLSAADYPASNFVTLPRLPHDLIAARNPFFDEVDIPDASLLSDAEHASDEPSEPSPEPTPEPQIRAVYMTAEGATALIDGRLVPIQNPQPAIESLRSNWGNDFSQSTSSTDN
jgi:hypothetical protein